MARNSILQNSWDVRGGIGNHPASYESSTMVGMARRAVPARVVAGGRNTRATLAIEGVAPLHAARTSQRDVPTTLNRYETPGYYQMSLRDNPALEPFRSKADLRLRRRLEFSIRPANDRHLADAGSYQINRAVFSAECSVSSSWRTLRTCPGKTRSAAISLIGCKTNRRR